MKALCLALLLMMSVSGPTFAQSTPSESSYEPAQPDAQAAFEKLKSLAGSWVGKLTVEGDSVYSGRFAQFSMRVTSRGNALVHELSLAGIPDHPLTMFYVAEDQLQLTHYCDAGNRPRMVGKISPDGKTLEFEFADLSGSDKHGHMHHAVITFIDGDHHTQEWTYMMPGDKPARIRFDLQRTNFEPKPAAAESSAGH